MNESRAVKHYLARYPKDWSFKQIIDHMSYEYDGEPLVTPKALYESVNGEELADLIVRLAERLGDK